MVMIRSYACLQNKNPSRFHHHIIISPKRDVGTQTFRCLHCSQLARNQALIQVFLVNFAMDSKDTHL